MTTATAPRPVPAVDDAIASYLNAIGAVPLLEAVKETELATLVAAGSTDARRRLIEANLRLVVSIAKPWARQGSDLMELVQEGNIGLIQAVDHFDSTLGNRFSTYATWWIKKRILDRVANRSLVRSPRAARHAHRVAARMAEALEREPRAEEVALELDRPISQVEILLAASRPAVSLDGQLNAEDDGSSLLDMLVDPGARDPHLDAVDGGLRHDVVEALQSLSDRSRLVIELRYGLADGQIHTLEDVAERLHISRERVRQIEGQGIARLRRQRRDLRTWVA
ncbi:MAG: RNA polymerase sigma factor RpoD/SigA [Candidatus Dormiibacterota bacterium]